MLYLMTEVKPRRRSREETRAETRRRLIEAATEVFAELGFHGASVEVIAERAGYTRGAFYSNFDGKDDLFLAVYDKRAEAQVEEVSGLMRASSDPGELFGALRERRDRTPVDPTWVILQTEFWLYA